MKLVQTFWNDTGADTQSVPTGGWLTSRYHLMSWTLSSYLLRKNHPNLDLELITDSQGKNLLIDILQLPYTHVRTDLDYFPSHVPKAYWAVKLLHSYSLHNTPFLNIDSDFFAFVPFPDHLLLGEVVAQNLEVGHALEMYRIVLNDIKTHWPFVPEFALLPASYSINAGIIGGTEHKFFREFYEHILLFLEKNKLFFNKLTYATGLNPVIEQYFLPLFAVQKRLSITGLLSDKTDTNYAHLSKFDQSSRLVPYIHTTLGAKQKPEVCEQLEFQLRLLFPNRYYNLIEKLNNINDFETTLRPASLLEEKQYVRTKKRVATRSNYIARPNLNWDRTELVAVHVGINFDPSCYQSSSTKLPSSGVNNKFFHSIFTYEKRLNQFNQVGLPSLELKRWVDKIKRLESINYLLNLPHNEMLNYQLQLTGDYKLISSTWNWMYLSMKKNDKFSRLNDIFSHKGFYQFLFIRSTVDGCVVEYLLDNVEIILLNLLKQRRSIRELVEGLASYYAADEDREDFFSVIQETVLTKIHKIGYKGILKVC